MGSSKAEINKVIAPNNLPAPHVSHNVPVSILCILPWARNIPFVTMEVTFWHIAWILDVVSVRLSQDL